MESEDLSGFLWAFVYVSGFKGHFVPVSLVPDIIADMQSRTDEREGAGELIKLKGVVDGGCDRPGMVMTDRPWETIKIDTFSLEFPTQDFEYFVEKLYSAPERKAPSGASYYKIHGWRHCVVLTPEMRDLVLEAMEEMLPEVQDRAAEADKEFSRRLREINKGGVKVISHRDKESPYVHEVRVPKKEEMN